jgi:hypothetical protein
MATKKKPFTSMYYTREHVMVMLREPAIWQEQLREAAVHRGLDVVGTPKLGLICEYLRAEVGVSDESVDVVFG